MLQLCTWSVCSWALHSLRVAFAPVQRPVREKRAFIDQVYDLIAVSVFFVPAIVAVAAVVVVIKQESTVVQITEEQVQLRITALRNA